MTAWFHNGRIMGKSRPIEDGPSVFGFVMPGHMLFMETNWTVEMETQPFGKGAAYLVVPFPLEDWPEGFPLEDEDTRPRYKMIYRGEQPFEDMAPAQQKALLKLQAQHEQEAVDLAREFAEEMADDGAAREAQLEAQRRAKAERDRKTQEARERWRESVAGNLSLAKTKWLRTKAALDRKWSEARRVKEQVAYEEYTKMRLREQRRLEGK